VAAAAAVAAADRGFGLDGHVGWGAAALPCSTAGSSAVSSKHRLCKVTCKSYRERSAQQQQQAEQRDGDVIVRAAMHVE
jgi:hypothetical protein